MLEQEISGLREEVIVLTAVVQNLACVIEGMKPVPEPKPEPVPEPKPEPKLEPNPEPNLEPEALDQKITREDIQSIALELVRADDSMKARIKAILTERGAATITKLSDADLRDVHGELLALAHKIAKEGEA